MKWLRKVLDLEAKVHEAIRQRSQARDLSRYRNDPVGYALDVLHVEPWAKQIEIAEALLRPPYKVLVKSSHNVGKSWTGAWLTSWFYDTRPTDSAVITTAPTYEAVKDLLWAEIREQRTRVGLGGFVGDSLPKIEDGPKHWAKGYTSEKGEAFHGRHLHSMLFVFDEAVGIDAVFWRAAASMFKPNGDHGWVCFFNPTDTTTEAFAQDRSGTWTVIEMGSLDHPNLHDQFQGRPPGYPNAVTIQQFETWMDDYGVEPIPEEDATATDFQWPPEEYRPADQEPRWYRPGPEMESRGLGRWPSQSTYNVWSDALWTACTKRKSLAPDVSMLPQIGADIARFGDDKTEFHTRWGSCSMAHETHQGWDTTRTTDRICELAEDWAARATEKRGHGVAEVKAEHIPLKVDDDGVGGGVTDQLRVRGMNVHPVGAGTIPIEPLRYLKRRCELWFTVAKLSRQGLLDLTRLDRQSLKRLREQAMAPRWKPDAAGRRVVEPKHETKKRLPRQGSPDAMDALNLAYAPAIDRTPERVGEARPKATEPKAKGSAQDRRGMFGRGR